MARTRTLLVASVVETVTRWVPTKRPPTVDRHTVALHSSTQASRSRWRRPAVSHRVLTFEHSELNTAPSYRADGAARSRPWPGARFRGRADAQRDGQRYVNRLVPAPLRPVVISPPKSPPGGEPGQLEALQGSCRLQIDQRTAGRTKRSTGEAGDRKTIKSRSRRRRRIQLRRAQAMGVYPGLDGAARSAANVGYT